MAKIFVYESVSGLEKQKKKIEFQLVLWSSSFHLFLARGYFSLVLVDPLIANSDQHQISPCNINALENRMVMRITNMITQDEFA